MANIVDIACPIDGLTVVLDFLQRVSDDMAASPVGTAKEYWVDDTVICANGHHWAINVQVLVERTL